MALNYIWAALILLGIISGLFKCFILGDTACLAEITNSTFEMSKYAFEITLGLTGTLALWMGILNIGERSGLVQKLAKGLSPVLSKLFPTVPSNHPALGSIFMNMSANMLGLDNAATPCGLKAMQDLQSLNTKKDTASDAMIMFLVLNTSGLTIIPVSIMAYRNQAMINEFGSYANMLAAGVSPTDVFIPLLIVTMCSTLAGLLIVSLYQHINLFKKSILIMFVCIAALVCSLFYTVSNMKKSEDVETFCNMLSGCTLLGVIAFFIVFAMCNKINVYDTFIEGAKNGFSVAVSLIPYCVAILVAIGIFKNSGLLSLCQDFTRSCFDSIGVNSEWVNTLPQMILKPLNGAGARGVMIDSWNTYGTCSFTGHLSSILQGSTDTTFYILAIYFGSVGIKKYRYSIICGIFADFIGMLSAILICYYFWG